MNTLYGRVYGKIRNRKPQDYTKEKVKNYWNECVTKYKELERLFHSMSYANGTMFFFSNAENINYLRAYDPEFKEIIFLPWFQKRPYKDIDLKNNEIEKELQKRKKLDVTEIIKKEDETCNPKDSSARQCFKAMQDYLHGEPKREIPLSATEKRDGHIFVERGEILTYTLEYLIKQGFLTDDVIIEELWLQKPHLELIKKWILKVVNDESEYKDWHDLKKDWFISAKKNELKNIFNDPNTLINFIRKTSSEESIDKFPHRLRFNPEREKGINTKNILFLTLVDRTDLKLGKWGISIILTFEDKDLFDNVFVSHIKKNDFKSTKELFHAMIIDITDYFAFKITEKSRNQLLRFNENVDGLIARSYRPQMIYIANDVYKIKKEEFREFLGNVVRSQFETITLIIARHWNSYTPILPVKLRENFFERAGGGYFFIVDGIGIVIDPGYNFIDILYRFHNYTVEDIDIIIVTHNHPDHHADLINLLTLFNETKKRRKLQHGILLYLNSGTKLLYGDFIDKTVISNNVLVEQLDGYFNEEIYKPIMLFDPSKKSEDMKIPKEKIKIKLVKGYHTEIPMKIDAEKNNVYGLLFDLYFNDSKSIKIGITGDTNLPEDPAEAEKFIQNFVDTDILIAHLGSIEEDWKEINGKKPHEIRYEGGHLGLINVAKLFRYTQPRRAGFLTEFGSELVGYRKYIVELIRKMSEQDRIYAADLQTEIKVDKGNNCFIKCGCGDHIKLDHADFDEEGGFLKYFVRGIKICKKAPGGTHEGNKFISQEIKKRREILEKYIS